MRKKIVILRVGVMTLIATLASMGMLYSSAYAKYAAQASGGATARVAKFMITLNGEDFTDKDIKEVNVFNKTITLSLHSKNSIMEEDVTNLETHISDTTGGIIAPGTGSKFEFHFTNDSEVSVRVWLDPSSKLTVSTATLGNKLRYKNDDSGWVTGANFSTLMGSEADSILLAPGESTALATAGKQEPLSIYWKWPFEVSAAENTSDTSLGKTATANVTIDFKFRAVQVD